MHDAFVLLVGFVFDSVFDVVDDEFEHLRGKLFGKAQRDDLGPLARVPEPERERARRLGLLVLVVEKLHAVLLDVGKQLAIGAFPAMVCVGHEVVAGHMRKTGAR